VSAGPQRFRQCEVARALRAAISAGIKDPRVEIDPDTGKITVWSSRPAEQQASLEMEAVPA